MNILILGTPKTGNTWIRQLLADLYGMPIRILPKSLDLRALANTKKGWIAQAHYPPTRELIQFAKCNNIKLITPIRHPCDVLVSFINYIRKCGDVEFEKPLLSVMSAGRPLNWVPVENFVRGSFFVDLNISISWLQAGCTLAVRYEDLWRETLKTLQQTTQAIHPAPEEEIENAIAGCDIDLLRRMPGNNPQFFQKGVPGSWVEVLPWNILELFRTLPTYQAQLRYLGYTLDKLDPLTAAPRLYQPPIYSLRATQCFTNGTLIAPIMEKFYFRQSSQRRRSWADPVDSEAPGSFFAFLTAPADADSDRQPGAPFISNIAFFIYGIREDLQKSMPDPLGRDRISFLYWFLTTAVTEYGLEAPVLTGVRNSFYAWANGHPPNDPAPAELPLITNYLLHIYERRPDLQRAFPSPFTNDRLAVANWFLFVGRLEHSLSEDLLIPIVTAWASQGRAALGLPQSLDHPDASEVRKPGSPSQCAPKPD